MDQICAPAKAIQLNDSRGVRYGRVAALTIRFVVVGLGLLVLGIVGLDGSGAASGNLIHTIIGGAIGIGLGGALTSVSLSRFHHARRMDLVDPGRH